MGYLVLQGDARRIPLADRSVHAVVTSSPYFGLRLYDTGEWVGGDPGCDHRMPRNQNRCRPEVCTIHSTQEHSNAVTWQTCGKCGAARNDLQIGLEKTPDDFCREMVKVGRELWRVLRDDGVMFWNIGDSYAGSSMSGGVGNGSLVGSQQGNRKGEDCRFDAGHSRVPDGLKPKDMIDVPSRLASALQADGWYLRDKIIWAKAEMVDDELEGSGMPGSQEDRCTFGYEVVLQLAKSPRYYFDIHGEKSSSGATLRNVWRINTEPNRLGHFALMPRKLAERCIRLATSEKGCCPACLAPWRRLVEKQRVATRPGNDSKVNRASDHEDSPYHGQNGAVVGNRDPKRHTTVVKTIGWEPTCRCGIDRTIPCRVLDPFGGLSTTAVAADALGRHGITVDLSRKYCEMGHRRLSRPHAPVVRPSTAESIDDLPLFANR